MTDPNQAFPQDDVKSTPSPLAGLAATRPPEEMPKPDGSSTNSVAPNPDRLPPMAAKLDYHRPRYEQLRPREPLPLIARISASLVVLPTLFLMMPMSIFAVLLDQYTKRPADQAIVDDVILAWCVLLLAAEFVAMLYRSRLATLIVIALIALFIWWCGKWMGTFLYLCVVLGGACAIAGHVVWFCSKQGRGHAPLPPD